MIQLNQMNQKVDYSTLSIHKLAHGLEHEHPDSRPLIWHVMLLIANFNPQMTLRDHSPLSSMGYCLRLDTV